MYVRDVMIFQSNMGTLRNLSCVQWSLVFQVCTKLLISSLTILLSLISDFNE